MKYISIAKLKLSEVPLEPGVYIFYNANKKPIYIGKAKILKHRVSSYFATNIDSPKTRQMLTEAKYISFIPTLSEVEAFLLEAELIKMHKPKFNIQLKDDKSYVYIIADKIKVEKGEYLSRVYVGRLIGRVLGRDAKYVGPFVEAQTTKRVLKALRRIFPHASCSAKTFKEHRKMGRPCLYGQIGLCPAPCINKDKMDENRKNITAMFNFIVKGRAKFVKEYEALMRKAAKNLEFEKAIKLRDKLEELQTLELASVLPTAYADNPNLVEDIYTQRLHDISQIFNLDALVKRIECYDISNLMGDWATASMVVSEQGRLAKKEYRRFRIKYTKGITDFGMLAEVLKRRAKKDWPKPDILLIDGGRGQVSSVLKALKGTKLENTLVVGIFKPHDYLIINVENYKAVVGKSLESATALATGWYVVRPKRELLGYQHLRQLRDEAHRFAKNYHKHLRNKAMQQG